VDSDSVALWTGLAFLVPAAWVVWRIARRRLRLARWPRAQATVRHVWRTKGQSSATGTSTSTTTTHARYRFDVSGLEQVGECTYLDDPKVGDSLEVMYDPANPKSNQPVYGSSLVGRVITLGFVIVFFGGLGVFMLIVAFGFVSL
jgi:uncharacterized protein DUF3592